MTDSDVMARIHQFNNDGRRRPELIQHKYNLMAANPFSFFRGACHLFYQDWPHNTPLNNVPSVWIAGDLHLENFGSYRGDNRLVYFDINDFDESVLAPCTWDVARLLTSILLGTQNLGIDDGQANQLGQLLVDTYAQTLAKGRIFHVERATAAGLIHRLLYRLKKRSHKTFLKQYTVNTNHATKQRRLQRLRVDHNRTVPLPAEERVLVKQLLETWRDDQYAPPFTKILDVVRHVAGLGSLGLGHYLVLVQDKSTAASNFLLTLKEETESSLLPFVIVPQPTWRSEAERVVTSQKRLQAVSPAMHHVVIGNRKSYMLREYQAENQRIKINPRHGKFSRIAQLVATLARISAWDHLRSAGHQGASVPDALIGFGKQADWQPQMLDYAHQYAAQVKADYAVFKTAHEASQEAAINGSVL